METVIALFAALMVLPYATVAWKKLRNQPRSYHSADALKPLEFILPVTRRELYWWVFVSITAGICEEILFRGFLLHFMQIFPWKTNLTMALLISSLIFGLDHLYGGIGGVVGSAVMGFLFGLLFLLSGNLLLSVILHSLTDLRMVVVLRPAVDRVGHAV